MAHLQYIEDLELEEFERELNNIGKEEEQPYINKNDIINFINEEVNNIIEHIPEPEKENIEQLEQLEQLEEINLNEIQVLEPLKRGRGRPKKLINLHSNEPKKNYYLENTYSSKYIKKGTKPTGRPKIFKTVEEQKQNHKELIKEYNLRRGHYLNKIAYYKKNYTIPNELLELIQDTTEDLKQKFVFIQNYITDLKLNNQISKNGKSKRLTNK